MNNNFDDDNMNNNLENNTSGNDNIDNTSCLLYTSPSPRD